ncbi:SRPBCC domain-containing protein [Humibacillus sp. DSM 29435]|uniref:SRPBCC domain-containing protein n=1 Tax=Humibacillus sp. DSM 29435 TaxID=1869167 RepID=UPI001586BFFE|nr:SRPBCC domain-containing protein [Humibacillus sp. DSM 29435]
MDVVHETLRFTREVDQPVDAVWAAYADVDHRTQWSVPSGEQIIYDSADFTVNGQDRYRCGPPGDLSNFGTHCYYFIDSPQRLVYSDTIRREGQLMAVAILTWDFEASDQGTRITVVDQVTSLVGQGMIDGHRNGHDKTLDRLRGWFGR